MITTFVTGGFILFLISLIIFGFVKFYKGLEIDPSLLSTSSWLIIVVVSILYFYSFIDPKGDKDKDKKKSKYHHYISAGLAFAVVFIMAMVARPGFYGEKYISHIWLICFICSYSAFSHYKFNSMISTIVNILITIFFSVCVFFYVSYAGASTFAPIKHIYELFDFLLLSKQLSMVNVVFWLLSTAGAYGLYTTQRYSNDKCVWNTNKVNLGIKSFIAIIYFVFVIYPFILHWRTYSIENTDLVHSKWPLLCFSLLMFGLFFQLAFDGRKNDDIADTAKKDNCDNIGRIDYLGSGAFNYIIWMCVGLLLNSIQIFKSKNIAVKNRSIAGPIDSAKYFVYNFFLTILHGLGTIFGGATLW